MDSNLEEVASDLVSTRDQFDQDWRNPVGFDRFVPFSQGSRQSAATLGFGSQPLCG
jgi:hypothetical protein